MKDNPYEKLNPIIHPRDYDHGNLKFANFFATPPMFFTKYFQEIPLIDWYQNGKAFLIAGGPSFANIDKDMLSSPGLLTMGINNSPKTFRPNLWICVDDPASMLQSIWMDPKIHKIVPISHIHKRLTDSHSSDNEHIETKIEVGDCPNVTYYRRNEVVNTDQYLFEDTINWGNHSDIGGGRSVFLAAIRVLYLLGIRKLFLLGVDFHMDANSKYHFPQDRNRGSINNNNNTYSSMKKWFGELKTTFDSVGFNIYNCNKESKLDVFSYMSFDDAVKVALDKFPVVVRERTAGLYTRKDDVVLKQKEIEARREAQNYNENDRIKAKEDLDNKKRKLNELKLVTERELMAVMSKLTQEQIETFKNTTAEVAKFNNLISKFNLGLEFKALIDAKIMEINSRKEMRNAEIEKNRIWGIVKK